MGETNRRRFKDLINNVQKESNPKISRETELDITQPTHEVQIKGYSSADTSCREIYTPHQFKFKITGSAAPFAGKIMQKYPRVETPSKDNSLENISRFFCAIEDWSIGNYAMGKSKIGEIFEPHYVFSSKKGGKPSYSVLFASLMYSYGFGFRLISFLNDQPESGHNDYLVEVEVSEELISCFEEYRDQFCFDHGVTTDYSSGRGNDPSAKILPNSRNSSIEYTKTGGKYYLPLSPFCNIAGFYPNFKPGCNKDKQEHSFSNGGGVLVKAEGTMF